MTRLFSILIPLTICLTTFGQHDFGIKINGGLSKITANRGLSNGSTKYIFCPSGQGGLFYNFNLGKRSLIGAELLFSQIESKEEMKILFTDNFGNSTGEFSITNLDYHLSYLSIPVYYGFKIKKLTINLGVQTSFLLINKVHYISKIPYNGTIEVYEGEGPADLDGFDFGPRVGLIFNLSQRFSIEGMYYYGINNILLHPSPYPEWNWKIQQATIGLRYNFINTKNDKTSEEKK